MDYWYSHEVSQQTIYNMDVILFLNLVRDDVLLVGIGNEFHSLGDVYDLAYQTRKRKTLEQLMHHWPTNTVYDYEFSHWLQCWVVKLFMACM